MSQHYLTSDIRSGYGLKAEFTSAREDCKPFIVGPPMSNQPRHVAHDAKGYGAG